MFLQPDKYNIDDDLVALVQTKHLFLIDIHI